ncbi:unannotated protein [freshwater metagenome]|uniref:Unannotated protein n=1 Tax=freshwater metagenome TaxID=449393 RepID=A0A6J7L091_9ZZZZ|nr:DUF3090 family protein [Actinomycetota bacterium]MSW37827.1 DUF3090 family protein [Actinomycetota bacterium]MSX37669.1 DUF3090 family protein [Actinomycetota bacterium]
MARQVFDFEQPERFVAGTVGQPGERQFYLQARDGQRIVSVALEKQQVRVLAERVESLLDEVVRRSVGEAAVPASAPLGSEDLAPLEAPVTEEFRVGGMSLGWNGDSELVIIEAHAVVEVDGSEGATDEDLELPELEADSVVGPDCLRVRLTGAAARAFAKRALSVVSAGRPPCPFCNLPLEPTGHICPRANGYRR